MKPLAFLGALLALGCSSAPLRPEARSATPPRVAIQPLGRIAPSAARAVADDLRRTFAVEVAVLPRRPLPPEAYTAPRRRHRADKILAYLERTTDRRFAKVMGLTSGDISVTLRGRQDWGVFGFASLGQRPCVVSSFRLRPPRATERLVRVARHELGHTLGLPHCPRANCVMEDANGTIRSVDGGKGEFCASCRRELGPVLRR